MPEPWELHQRGEDGEAQSGESSPHMPPGETADRAWRSPTVLFALAFLCLVASVLFEASARCENDPYFWLRAIPYGLAVLLGAYASFSFAVNRTHSMIVGVLAALAGGVLWGFVAFSFFFVAVANHCGI